MKENGTSLPRETPFTERILEVDCPKKFNPPTLPPYNDLVDPSYFLFKCKWHISAAKATDEIRCTYFPLCLEGATSLWFTKLRPKSIDRLYDLAKKFKEQFRLYATKAKDAITLSAMK